MTSIFATRPADAKAGRLPQAIRTWFGCLWWLATTHNDRNIIAAATMGGDDVGNLIDLGCDDGTRTMAIATRVQARDVLGVEIVRERAMLARQSGVAVIQSNLQKAWPVRSGSVDLAVSNQVIEHVSDTDHFCAEISRILRPGGIAVISTENLASWHNVVAVALGWQPFSLTNISARRLGIGNPLALHRGERLAFTSWQHVRVFSYLGLSELLQEHGLAVERIWGAGYFPAPSLLARWDPRHAAYLTVRVRKRQ